LRVIALQGSPRRDGHTALLLETFLLPFRAEHEVKRIDVCYQHILPCMSCYACQQSSSCLIEDDMATIYPHLALDDIIVLASPIYFYGVTAQLKTVIDRCQQFWTTPSRRKAARVGVLLLTAGAKDAQGTGVDTTVAATRVFLTCIGAPLTHIVAATHTDVVPAVAQGEVLRQATAIAAHLAQAKRGGLSLE